MVELRDRQVVVLQPAVATVEGDEYPAIVAAHDVLGVLRVHPQVVPVAVRSTETTHLGEALASVIAGDERPTHLE